MRRWLRRLLPWIVAPAALAVVAGAATPTWWALLILGAVGAALALKVYEEGWSARRIVARRIYRAAMPFGRVTPQAARQAECYVESIPWWHWLGADQDAREVAA